MMHIYLYQTNGIPECLMHTRPSAQDYRCLHRAPWLESEGYLWRDLFYWWLHSELSPLYHLFLQENQLVHPKIRTGQRRYTSKHFSNSDAHRLPQARSTKGSGATQRTLWSLDKHIGSLRPASSSVKCLPQGLSARGLPCSLAVSGLSLQFESPPLLHRSLRKAKKALRHFASSPTVAL